ncbi:MAG: rhomboid family intramembrane serine protease [Gammaproteobacteria bacterium]
MSEASHIVFAAASAQQSAERALVLRTQGIGAESVFLDGRHVVLVSAADSARAAAELADYERENAEWKPRPAPFRHERHGAWPGVAAYVFVVVLLALFGPAQPGGEWFSAGKVDAGLVREGQWWRTVTALTLHVDIAHLSANLVFGGVLGYLVGQFFGSGIAWFSIVLAGALGNALNSVLMAPTHTSVGASTAIFAALGLLAAYSWKRKYYPQDRWAYRLGPIIAGIALLAYTGTGGERTDVSAHITGFLAGGGAGIVLAMVFDRLRRDESAQWVYGGITIGLVTASWIFAL